MYDSTPKTVEMDILEVPQYVSPSQALTEVMPLNKAGWVVIPIAICNAYCLKPLDYVSITMLCDTVIVEKYIKDFTRFRNRVGVIQQIDELNKITIPKEMRKELGMRAWQPIEVQYYSDKIVIVKQHTTT